jgi:heterodisulfide reductase subunit C
VIKGAIKVEKDDTLAEVREMVQSCIQCGTCTASCPNEFAMDLTPRRLWRLVLMGRKNAVFASRTFALCSNCYTCTLRCPRGLPLTGAMAALKREAARLGLWRHRSGILFSKVFIDNVRRHGRVREMELMTRYFAGMKSPLLPLRFTPLGLKLLARGKVALQRPAMGKGKLEPFFARIAELEKPIHSVSPLAGRPEECGSTG